MTKCPTCGQTTKTTTSKQIQVDGVVYSSYNKAAKHIVSMEAEFGNTRQTATISREISTFVNSTKEERIMYGMYKIERVS